MCKKHLAILAAVVAAGTMIASPAAASSRCHMVASITARQEVPPAVGVNGFGCGEFLVDTAANTVRYRIVYSGLTGPEVAAHIHGFAPPGVNAGVVHNLPPGSPKVGVWNYPEALEPDILAGRCYVNIHTAANPGGEIRGQITTHVAELDSGQEVPPNPTGSRGWAVLHLDKCANTLNYHIVINSLSGPESAAHIHGIANHGVNAGVVHPLPLGPVKIGSWNYPEAFEEAIEDGRFYINIHTAAFPGGEIRGQIVGSLAVLDAQQEVPANPSTACGCAFLSLDRSTNALGFDIRYFGLIANEVAAHFHGFAPPGVNAGVLFNLPAGNPKRGTWNFGAGNLLAMLDQRTYINIHSAALPGGEIRGQVNLQRACLQFGDANYDEFVNFGDVSAVLSNFGNTYGLPEYDPINQGDADYDGDVDFNDLTVAISNFGACYR